MLTQPYLSFLVMIYIVTITIDYQVLFIQISIIQDNMSSQVVDRRRYGFGQWMNSSIIHENICSLIHKMCHPKSYHSDIKYHMIINNIFSSLLRSSIAHK